MPRIHQPAVLTRDPTANLEAATKKYVDDAIIAASASAGLFVIDVTPTGSGIVSNKQYVAGTVPPNVVVDEATTDTQNIRITVLAEGGPAFYSPTVTVDTSPGPGVVATLTQDPNDIRTYTGYADITVSTDRTVTITSSTGAVATVDIVQAAAPPEIQSMTFGSLPGLQTAVKQGDVMTVSGVVENDAVLVTLIGGTGAVGSGTFTTSTTGGSLGSIDSAGSGFRNFVIQFTVGNATGTQTATAYPENTFGSQGSNFVTTNTILLDQTFPNIGPLTVNYPAGQQALKGSETATVDSVVTDFDTISYTSSADLNITNPTTYNASKTVQRVGGSYVFNGNNYTITAFRAANDSQSSATTDINIANIDPTVAISIAGSPARLISSPSGEDYIVTVTSSQQLLSAPSLTATSGTLGTVSGSGTTWTATLTITDGDPTGTQTFDVPSATNLANTTSNPTITSGETYVVGGFTTREIVVGALEQVVDIGVDIIDPTKVEVRYADTIPLLTYRGSDLSNFVQGWSKIDGTALVFTPGAEPFPNYSNFVFEPGNTSWLFLTDAAFAGTNTTGSLTIEITETA